MPAGMVHQLIFSRAISGDWQSAVKNPDVEAGRSRKIVRDHPKGMTALSENFRLTAEHPCFQQGEITLRWIQRQPLLINLFLYGEQRLVRGSTDAGQPR